MATAMNIKELRVRLYGLNIPVEGLRRYRVSEQQIAGVCGTEFCHPPYFDVSLHSHYAASFCVVLQGGLTELSRCRRRDLAKGSIVFTPPGEIHREIFHAQGGRCFLVEFLPAWDDRLLISGMKIEESVERNNTELIYLAFKLYKEFRHADNLSALAVEGLGLELLAEFCRRSNDKSKGHSPGWLGQAKDLLHDRFADPLIALSAGFSDQAHLSRVFKNQTGTTPARYRETAAFSE